MKNLDKAMKLHRKHLDNPKTATMKSQMEMMKLMDAHKKEMSKSKPGKAPAKRK